MTTYRVTLGTGTTAGSRNIPLPFRAVFIRVAGTTDRDIELYAGFGTSELMARVKAYGVRDIELPAPVDSLTVAWDAGSFGAGLVDFLVSDGAMRQDGAPGPILLDRDTFGAPQPWAAVGHPAPSSANVGMVALAYPSASNAAIYQAWNGLPIKANTYASTFKRSARDYTTNSAFAAPGQTVVFSLWNLGPSKYVRLIRADAAVFSASAACEIWIDLYRITTQPTGGAAADIATFGSSQPATVADAKRLPGGGAALSGFPLGSAIWRLGVTGADPTTNPAPGPDWQTVYAPDYAAEQLPYVPESAGLALVLDINAAATVRYAARMKWTEEAI